MEIAAMISQELVVHAESEQETFYKALENYPSTKEDAQHGLKEHKEIEDLIKQVADIKKVDAAWVKKVKKLKEVVEHHVHEEEGTIFKRAKEVLSDAAACAIKEQMHYLKGKLILQLEKAESVKNYFYLSRIC